MKRFGRCRKYNLLESNRWSVDEKETCDLTKTRETKKIKANKARLSRKLLGVVKRVFVQDCICWDIVPPQHVWLASIDTTVLSWVPSIAVDVSSNMPTQKNPRTSAARVAKITSGLIIRNVLENNILSSLSCETLFIKLCSRFCVIIPSTYAYLRLHWCVKSLLWR